MARPQVDPFERRDRLIQEMRDSIYLLEREREETSYEKLILLGQQAQQLKAGTINPYKRRFVNFLAHCVWTVDEARGGQVRKFPIGYGEDGKCWDDLWLQLEHELLTHPLNFLEKARRVLASWYVCAFDVWLAAGGQDPRWQNDQGLPILMQSDRNRQIVVAARKQDGYAGANWYVETRILSILKNFEEHSRHLWPDFPQWRYTEGEIKLSNGSRITGVPQGSDQTRGGGATHLHFEEVAFWEQARSTIGGAVPTVKGGGHVTCITTAQAGSFAKEIRDGTIRHEEVRAYS